jgi:hypothetical protein
VQPDQRDDLIEIGSLLYLILLMTKLVLNYN